MHSQLNKTTVDRVIEVESVSALQHIVRSAAASGLGISIAGGRHAMGGQQFGTGTVMLDMRRLSRVLELDSERGLVVVEAGIDWPRLINHLLWAGASQTTCATASSRNKLEPTGSRSVAHCPPTFTAAAFASVR